MTDLPERETIVAKCLTLCMDELVIEVRKGLELCKKRIRSKSNVTVQKEHPVSASLDERWPEEMIDNTI